MIRFLKFYLKYIILAIVGVAVLVSCGAYNLKRVVDVEERKSSYTRTQFDFFISSPDKTQVDEIKGYSCVDKVFPFYALSKAFGASKQTEKIYLLVSDDLDNYDISIFTEKTCVEGEFNKDGIMLDIEAADVLGVGVGDTVSFNIVGKSITKTVSGLYLTSTYGTLTSGVALTSFSDDISAVYSPKAYSAAFIQVNDGSAFKSLTADYVGEGNVVYTYEEYKKVNGGTMLPGQDPDEYEATIREKYEKYREDTLATAKKGGMQVASKADAYQLVKDKIETTEKSISSFNSIISISALVLFALVGIIFVIINIGDDRIRRDDGMGAGRMIAGYVAINLLLAVVTAGATLGILFALGSATYFMDVFMTTVLYFSLPVVISFPVVVLFVILYVIKLYSA
jgi:hypothetical protein